MDMAFSPALNAGPTHFTGYALEKFHRLTWRWAASIRMTDTSLRVTEPHTTFWNHCHSSSVEATPRLRVMLENLARPGNLCTKSLHPPSSYEKTSTSACSPENSLKMLVPCCVISFLSGNSAPFVLQDKVAQHHPIDPGSHLLRIHLV
jgi:hypothetical protein